MTDSLELQRLQMMMEVEEGLNVYIIDDQFRYTYFNREHIEGMKNAFGADVKLGIVKTELLPEPLCSEYCSLYETAFASSKLTHVLKFEDRYINFDLNRLDLPDGRQELLIKSREVTTEIKIKLELEKYRESLEAEVDKKTKTLSDQRDYFQKIIDEDPNLIFLRDRKGVFIMINQSMVESLGVSREEILNQTIHHVFREEEEANAYFQEDQDILETGRSIESIEKYYNLNGKKCWLSVKKKKVVFNNRPLVLGVMSDVTQIISVKDKLEQANAELSHTVHELKEMQLKLVASEKIASILRLTSGFLHEMNNPINYVAGNVAPLRRDIDELQDWLLQSDHLEKDPNRQVDFEQTSEEIHILLHGIDEGTSRVKQLLEGFKNLAATEESEYAQCQMIETIEMTLTMLDQMVTSKELSIVKNYGSKDTYIDSVPSYLHQIFINIFDYILSRVNDKDKVIISIGDADEFQVVEVIDHQRGITQQEILKMIDPFDSLVQSSKLGLAISYRIISLLQGKIDVTESTAKTHFKIYIPKRRSE